MTRSLRRSRRAPKKNSDYNVGDVVEIVRGDVVLHGRLAQLLTEGSSPNPRWLIKFDGQNHKHEEMYEKSFGKMISASSEVEEPPSINHSATDSPPSNATSQKSAATKPMGKGAATAPKKGGTTKTSGTSSEGEGGEESKTTTAKSSKRSSAQSDGGSVAGSDSAAEDEKAMTSRDRMSAREARSRRRQAKIDEDAPLTAITATGGIGEEAAPSAKRRLQPPPNHGKKRQRQADDGEVVKVKLLTGSLYLYRGQHRRVEFVRRV